MTTYKYEARDRAGKSSSGTIQAASESDLRRILRANDLYLTKSQTPRVLAKTEKGSGLASPFGAKASLQDMVIAMRQLGSTVRAGLPIIEALDIVSTQSNKPTLVAAFEDIRSGVTEGQYLSAGMRRHPRLFSRLVVSLVEAGETAGTLDRTLDIAADQLEREDDLRRRVKSATFYPKMVVLACVGTIAGMLLIVVPVFSQIYSGFHAKLPAPTLLLMALSDAVVRGWWLFVLFGGATSYGFRRYIQTPRGRQEMDRRLLQIPILGPVLRKIAIARFVQTLAGAMRGGVPILTALQISANTAGNTMIRTAIEAAANNVRDGAGIASELEKTGQFPILVTRMISAGESTGNIDTMLEEINRFYDRDIDHAVDKLTKMIEPLMTILIGGIVLLVLLALYMPIFSLGGAITGKK